MSFIRAGRCPSAEQGGSNSTAENDSLLNGGPDELFSLPSSKTHFVESHT